MKIGRCTSTVNICMRFVYMYYMYMYIWICTNVRPNNAFACVGVECADTNICIHATRTHTFTHTYIEGYISLSDRANMNPFMGRRNQIECFVRFKVDRSLRYLQYDPYVYHDVYL